MKTFLRILTFAKPHWVRVIIAFISSIFYSIFNAMSLWIVSSLIGTIMVSENVQTENLNSNSFHNKIDNFFDIFFGHHEQTGTLSAKEPLLCRQAPGYIMCTQASAPGYIMCTQAPGYTFWLLCTECPPSVEAG